ncbi:MAG: DUF4442 domain-containing protein [Flavobacteriales bacterium]|jgi:acyl-coenzyme A thioesterase PaaI-like protein|nr:DUF4442 domain-containing protein [Flavobacteriales bacterium]
MTVLKTNKKEGLKNKISRLIFNHIPPYRGTGGKVVFISDDWREVQVKLPLTWRTKNIVGSVFGGSIYASIDPIYMAQLMKILGENYVVWDKSAEIQFKKPIKKTVYTRFLITDDLINKLKREVVENGEYSIDLPVVFEDLQGTVYANITKQIYVASKTFYKQKQAKRNE